MPQDAEPGSRHGAQPNAVVAVHQVVLAVAEEGEVPVREPAQQLLRLRRGRIARHRGAGSRRAGQAYRQVERHRTHPALVLHGHPHVIEDPAQIGRELVVADPVARRRNLDVDPGLGELVPRLPAVLPVRRGHAENAAQRSCHVPAYPELRVHENLDVGVVLVQLHRHGVDQVGHVVDDDVHHQPAPGGPGRVKRGRAQVTHLDKGAALRAMQAELRVHACHRGHPLRLGQVLRGHAQVVGLQVRGDVPDRPAELVPRAAGHIGGQIIPESHHPATRPRRVILPGETCLIK